MRKNTWRKNKTDELKLLLIAHWLPRKIEVFTTARDIAIPINSQVELF